MKKTDLLINIMSLPVIITETASFILLGSFAIYFNKKLYKELESVYESEK